MSYAVYVYPDASGSQGFIRADALNWTGTWASTGTYFAESFDAVLYGNDRYLAVTDNVGVNPTAVLRNPTRRNPFSFLAVWQAGDEPPFAPPEPPPPTDQMFEEVLEIAWAGTAAAYEAQQTAWNGTAAANAAIDLANQAMITAWAGTATDTSLAELALETAWVGTAAAQVALETAWTGTAAAQTALAGAAAASDLAYIALTTAWAGTVVTGGADAYVALQTAWAGTAAAAAAINLANQAYPPAWAGTAAAAASIGLSNQALQMAWNGTAAAAAGISLANSALTVAYAGTAAVAAGSNLAMQAHREAGTKLDLAGGTLTGRLYAPNVQVGVGTVPYSTSTGGTIYYDFFGSAYQQTTVREGALFVSARNFAPGAEIAVVLQQSGISTAIGFSSSFTWYGTVPPSSIYTKNILVAMTSLGTNLSNVIAAVSVAQ